MKESQPKDNYNNPRQSRRPRAVVLKGLTDHLPQNVLDSFIGNVDLLGQGL